MKYLAIITFILFISACENKGKKVVKEEAKEQTETSDATKNVTFTGTVLNANDSTPISSAMILIPGTTSGTISGPDGKFGISGPENTKKLAFAMNGFENANIEVKAGEEVKAYLIPKN